jgi:hypothetical protein
MKKDYLNFKGDLKQDDIYPTCQVQPLQTLTGYPCRKGLSKAIISGGEIVNVVSNSYGHLPNELFFNVVEEHLINADINYIQRTINRDNRSFAADYILADDSYHIHVKNGIDKMRPMLRFTNSYDGSCRTSGHFGFFREVCSNGLHVAQTNFGFSVKHKGSIAEIVIGEISGIIKKFIDNEYYTLQRKFEVLAETPLTSLEGFIQVTAEEFNLFKYETSETNPAPSMNARIVADTIRKEANLLGTNPNYWLAYNAFNELLHGKLKKTFENQRSLDARIFAHTLELASAS